MFINIFLKIIANTFWKVLNYYYYLLLLLDAFIYLISSEASIIYRNMMKLKYTVYSF